MKTGYDAQDDRCLCRGKSGAVLQLHREIPERNTLPLGPLERGSETQGHSQDREERAQAHWGSIPALV